MDTGLAWVFRRDDNENNPNTIIPFRSVTALLGLGPGGGWLTSPYMASITTIVSRPFPFPAEYFKFYFQHSTLTWSQSRSRLATFSSFQASHQQQPVIVLLSTLYLKLISECLCWIIHQCCSSHLLEMLDNDATELASGIINIRIIFGKGYCLLPRLL